MKLEGTLKGLDILGISMVLSRRQLEAALVGSTQSFLSLYIKAGTMVVHSPNPTKKSKC